MTYPHEPPEPEEHPQYWQNPYWQDPAWQEDRSSAPPPDEQITYGAPAYSSSSGQVSPMGSTGLQAPPPPRKRRRGLWGLASAISIILTALLVLAFGYPGYLLGGSEGEHAAGGSTGGDGGGARAMAEELARAVESAEPSALRAVACSAPAPRVSEIVSAPQKIRPAHDVSVRWVRRVSAERALTMIGYASAGRRTHMKSVLIRIGGEWCWRAIADMSEQPPPHSATPTRPAPSTPTQQAPTTNPAPPPTTQPTTGGADRSASRQVISSLLNAIRQGQTSSAQSLLCRYALRMTVQRVKELAENRADLRILSMDRVDQVPNSGYIAQVAGTAKGNALTGSIGTFVPVGATQPCVGMVLLV